MDLSRKTVVRSIVFVGHVDAGKSTFVADYWWI
ncbi:eukaryotic peptide chain release factor subunit 3 [Enterocytozoon bieneusi H348]|nr:eukaryotic peptide chain release factor subunit 3 [Enterocytozoon bieneusi H348]|eukprot:XP_002651536.1 eukaryotic peptide chain release factor subunit 3 [Enterocytozoon bieneusi H348]